MNQILINMYTQHAKRIRYRYTYIHNVLNESDIDKHVYTTC